MDPWKNATLSHIISVKGASMQTIFHEKIRLSVVVGKGSLTAYEAATLKPGDVVTTSDRDAGEYASVYFNSQLAAYGEIFVVDDVFAVRIVKTAWRTSPVPYPGETDELAEILDTEIQLASISVSLHQMKGAGPYTVVNLGKKHTPRDNAELLVAGIPAALGTVCFIGQGWAFRVSKVYHSAVRGATVHTSDSLIRKGQTAGELKIFDFTRPDKFSRDQLWTVQRIHARFIRNMAEISPVMSKYTVQIIDQLPYGEVLEKHGPGARSIIAEAASPKRPGPKKLPRAYYVEADDCGFPLAPETVEKLKTQAEITEIAPPFKSLVIFYKEESELAGWLRSHNVNDTVLPLLRNAWKQRISMKPLVGESADEDQARKLIQGNEMTLLVGLGPGDDGANSFSIVYPYIYLQKVLNRLS
jgi:flagellar motor switch protein FliM